MKHVYEQGTNGKTLIMLHGTGGDEYDLIPLAKHIDPHANILSIRGNVQEYGMPRFFKRLAMGVFDQDSLIEETYNLRDFIQESSINYGFDPHQTIVVGYSNGANIAASLLLHFDQIFHRAILFRAMVPIRKDDHNNLEGVKILLLSGQHDQTVPQGEPEQLQTFFEHRHATVELKWIDHGHQLTKDELEFAKAWYQQNT